MTRVDWWQRHLADRIGRITNPTRFQSVLGNGPEMARLHCEGRNRHVLYLLAYLQHMSHRDLLGAAPNVTIEAANGQAELSPRQPLPIPPNVQALMDELGVTPTERDEIGKKCYTTQDAHLLPGQVRVNGRLPHELLDPQNDTLRFAHLTSLFMAVDRLPTLINETDTQAEGNRRRGGELAEGLCRALRSACQQVLDRHRSRGVAFDIDLIRQVFREYVARAQQSIRACVQRNEQRLAGELRSAPIDRRFYYLAKRDFLELYARFTASETSEHYGNPRSLVTLWD